MQSQAEIAMSKDFADMLHDELIDVNPYPDAKVREWWERCKIYE